MPVDVLEDPWRYAHRAATLPVRPLGNLLRRGSNAMTDLQPVAAELGDKAVDAFAGPISDAAGAGLNAASDALIAAGAPAATAALGTAGAGAGAGAGSVAGPVGTALGGGLGSVLGGLLGSSGTALAGGMGKALATATPALMKLAAPAVKAAGRVAYHGLNDAVDASANVLGSTDDNPATSRGLRALKEAQNPFSMKGLLARGPSDWAKEAGNVPELIDATMGEASTPSMSAPPLPMDGRGPAGDALKRSAPAVMAPPKPQTVGPPGPQFNGDASMMGPRTNSDRSGSDYGYSKPDGGVGFSDGPMSMPGQKTPARQAPKKPLTSLLQQGVENPVEKAEPMSEAAEGPPHAEPPKPFRVGDWGGAPKPGQIKGWNEVTGTLSQILNDEKYRGQQSPNDTFGYRGRR